MNFPPWLVTLAILLAAAGASTLVSNETASISDDYPTIITPGQGAFGIWAFLFSNQIVLTVWPTLFNCLGRDRYGKPVRGWDPKGPRMDIRWAYVFIGVWAYIFLLHKQLTTFFPSVLCLALALIFTIRAKQRGSFSRSAGPLSLLISWLVSATVVNTAVWLKYQFALEDNEVVAGFTLVLFPVVASLAAYYNSDWLLSLGLCWTLAWIYESTQSYIPLVHILLVVVGSVAFRGRGKDVGLELVRVPSSI